MSLFDTITVEFPLPILGLEHLGTAWQTRSLNEAMENYLFTADGVLMRERFHTEDRSDRSNPGLLGLKGSLTKIHEEWDETGFSGTINFYGHVGEKWCEYDSEFVDGQIVSIKRVERSTLEHPEFGLEDDSGMPEPPALNPKMKRALDDFAANSRIQQKGPRILSALRNSPLVGAEIETSRDPLKIGSEIHRIAAEIGGMDDLEIPLQRSGIQGVKRDPEGVLMNMKTDYPLTQVTLYLPDRIIRKINKVAEDRGHGGCEDLIMAFIWNGLLRDREGDSVAIFAGWDSPKKRTKKLMS